MSIRKVYVGNVERRGGIVGLKKSSKKNLFLYFSIRDII